MREISKKRVKTDRNFITIKSDEKLPKKAIPIFCNKDFTFAVKSFKMLQAEHFERKEELPKNSICIQINKNLNAGLTSNIGVIFPRKTPLQYITLKKSDDLPINSVIIQADNSKIIAAIAPNKKKIKCVCLNDGNPNVELKNTLVVINDVGEFVNYNHSSNEKLKPRIAIFDEEGKQIPLQIQTLGLFDEIPENSAIVRSDKYYKIVAKSTKNTPLRCILLSENEKPPGNSIVIDEENDFDNWCIGTEDNSPLELITVKAGGKFPQGNDNFVFCRFRY